MEIFLKLKHWQLFVIWILGTIQAAFLMQTFLWPFSFAIYFLLVFGWVYSIGKFLNKNNVAVLKKLNIWSVILIIAFIPYGIWSHQILTDSTDRQNGLKVFASLVLGSIAFINIAIIAAKSIKEKEKALKFTDYFVELLLILYLFIGVWILQNRLNKIIRET